MLSRRQLLSSAVAAPALPLAAALGGCVVVNGQPQLDPTIVALLPVAFVDQVTALVAAGCNAVGKYIGYVPTAASIAASVAAIFGLAAVGPVITGIANAAVTVAKDLCSAAPATPAAAEKLGARLKGSSLASPVVIGRAPSGVVVHGYAR